jgi:hypothetical protein
MLFKIDILKLMVELLYCGGARAQSIFFPWRFSACLAEAATRRQVFAV